MRRRFRLFMLAALLPVSLNGCYSMVSSGDRLVGEVGGYVSDKELARVMMPMSMEERTIILQAMKEGEPVRIGCSRGPGNFSYTFALAPWNLKLKEHELVEWVRGDHARQQPNRVVGRLESSLLTRGELARLPNSDKVARNYNAVSGVYKIACFPPDAR